MFVVKVFAFVKLKLNDLMINSKSLIFKIDEDHH